MAKVISPDLVNRWCIATSIHI